MYPKYSKHWLSTTVAHTIDCACSKILNHGLNHVLLFSLFKFFGWKNILNQLENSGLKSRFLFSLIFQFYLMYRLICQKPAHFLSAQMALMSTFFKCLWYMGSITLVWGWNVLQSVSSLPFLSDIDIYINGGFEPEEVEIEIDAIDEIFVPTNQGKTPISFKYRISKYIHPIKSWNTYLLNI